MLVMNRKKYSTYDSTGADYSSLYCNWHLYYRCPPARRKNTRNEKSQKRLNSAEEEEKENRVPKV
jgi:hypothetical protein